MVTIRAMGQTFVVKNHLPPQTPTEPPRQPTPPPPTSPIVAMATFGDPHNIDHDRLSDDDDELATVCEDPSPPDSDPTSSSPSPPVITTASVTTCADRSDDYQDFLSKFGILSLPLHPSLDRQSVVQIDSPDDTLVSGSLSPLLDQLDPLLTPDVPPSIGGKCPCFLIKANPEPPASFILPHNEACLYRDLMTCHFVELPTICYDVIPFVTFFFVKFIIKPTKQAYASWLD